MNIEEITHYIVKNYNENVDKFIKLINEIDCDLIYNGKGMTDCINNRSVYACSIKFIKKPIDPKKKCKGRILQNVFPIMIGSKLDVAIRKYGLTEFKNLDNIPNLAEGKHPFEYGDIAICCFLINGALKQIPFFITNDVTNPHIVKKSIVRLYRYDSNEKGQELTMYFMNMDSFQRGDVIVRLNDGTHSTDVEQFFECPYPVDSKVYLEKIYSGDFNIDNLENRIVISPGHLFYKLFTKNLYIPLRDRNYDLISKKHSIVCKSIENGDLLHIISKKTLFFKENNITNKMVSSHSGHQHREVGQNDEIYIEKKSTPYRDANCQIYPYFPYLAHFTNLQISNKVKSKKILAFSNSYIGFLCLFGTSEAKNVGRVMMLARDTFVSTQDNTNHIYSLIGIKLGHEGYYVVVNSACISITYACFLKINLVMLKKRLKFVECFPSGNFILINYKMGLLYKKLNDDCWVTARDFSYWREHLYPGKTIAEFINAKGYDFITSYSVDLLKYAKHNAFPKNLLAINALKNSVLSTTPVYSRYFKETISAYVTKTDLYEPVLEPQTEFSKHYVMYLPKLNIMFMSYKGCTQEDCIVMREDLDVFDIQRLYTAKIKFEKLNSNLKYFHPRIGPSNPFEKKSFLGTLVCPTDKIKIASQTMHLIFEEINSSIIQVYFNKPHFSILEFYISPTSLMITIESLHKCSTGDKLCSLNGQKGVLQKHKDLPFAVSENGEKIVPDMLINCYCIISRQTMGQISEALDNGGRDYTNIYNSDGVKIPGIRSLIGKVSYIAILYLSSEHYYTATDCNKDKIIGQPVRGRSRNGGMRSGNMEQLNGFRGNGIADCFEEVMLENSDRIIHKRIPIPQSVILCNEDGRFFKTNVTYYSSEPVIEHERTIVESISSNIDSTVVDETDKLSTTQTAILCNEDGRFFKTSVSYYSRKPVIQHKKIKLTVSTD